jgi:transposase-like protein
MIKNSLNKKYIDSEIELPYCPICKINNQTIKSGKRKIKDEIIQTYYCKSCSKRFTNRKIKRTSYTPTHIVNAITFFNLGHTLGQTVKNMSRKYKIKIPISTLNYWVHRYNNELPFIKLRTKYNIDPENIIRTKKLQHQQPYLFQVHSLKLNLAGKQFPKLKHYINLMIMNSQDNIFQNKDVLRCSELAKKIKIETPRIKQINSNLATKLTNLGMVLAKTKKERHQVIENFFLTNDSVTIATEIPVYILKNEADFENDLVGHIDLIQVRNNKIHVLDYKPEVENTKTTIAQLALYSRALSMRTKIPESYFMCAYFNEDRYCQFNLL